MKQEAKTDEEIMLNELLKHCWSRILCEKNQKDGKTCIFYKYCTFHTHFEKKDIERLYERMKKRMEKDGRTCE